MLIGIDASRANEEKKTGVGWYAYYVIQQLKHLSTQAPEHSSIPQELRVILYTDKSLQGKLAELPENWEEHVLGWKPWRLWTQVRLSWEMLVHKPDVLFIPAHVFPIIHPKKTVMTIHDIAAIRFPEAYNWFEKWYTVWSAKFALKKLWRVIAPSDFTKNELISLQVSKFVSTRIKTVYHGFDNEYKKIEDKIKIEEVFKKYNITRPYLLNIGRLETKKNTQRIIEAFDKLKKNYQLPITNYQLVLIGSKGYGYEKIKEAMDASPYKNDIITPGWVENDDLPYLMSGAEVFVFPSLYEGFGIPILEAQACSTPVVTSRGLSLEEVGGDGCVYVNPESVDDITYGILELIMNNEYKTTNVEKGLENVKKFSWEKCAKETLGILLSED